MTYLRLQKLKTLTCFTYTPTALYCTCTHKKRVLPSCFPGTVIVSSCLFFLFFRKEPLKFSLKKGAAGVGCLGPSANSWEVWFHRLPRPCHSPDWAGQQAQERPRLLKDTNRWEATAAERRGQHEGAGQIEKAGSTRPCLGRIHKSGLRKDGQNTARDWVLADRGF